MKTEDIFLISYLDNKLSATYLCVTVLNIYTIETKIPTAYALYKYQKNKNYFYDVTTSIK